jgi:hypothetical protein
MGVGSVKLQLKPLEEVALDVVLVIAEYVALTVSKCKRLCLDMIYIIETL